MREIIVLGPSYQVLRPCFYNEDIERSAVESLNLSPPYSLLKLFGKAEVGRV